MASRKRVPRPALPKPGEAAAPRGRGRTEVSDADAKDVRAKANAVDPSTSPQGGKSSRRRIDKPEKATYYLPEQVAEEIAIMAVRRKTSASAVVTEALEAYLAAAKAKAS